MLPLFQSPLNILCEICDIKNRWKTFRQIENILTSGKHPDSWSTLLPGVMSSVTRVSPGLLVRLPSLLLVRINFETSLSLTTLFPRLVDRLLETDQDCLGCAARLPPLLVDSAPRVPALADLEVENQGGVEDPHQDRRDQRGQTSPRSHPQTAEDGGG